MTRPVCLLLLFALVACKGPEARTAADGTAATKDVAEGVLAAPEEMATPEEDVRPGINDNFLDPDLDVAEWVERFEGESREIYSHRTKIARACGFAPGMEIADVGAGTGLFTFLFAQDVGRDGAVYAVDISQNMIDHVGEKAAERGMTQVRPVLGSVREVNLPADSVDAVFVCDTYHHFNYPMTTLASIREALRPGGSLIVVDFERIPGVSREWTLGHVRAGKEVFRQEIEDAGFAFVEELDVEGLEENYFLRFRAP